MGKRVLPGPTRGVFTLTFDADATVARVAVPTKRFGFGLSRPGTADRVLRRHTGGVWSVARLARCSNPS
jgi:hypothetical protein